MKSTYLLISASETVSSIAIRPDPLTQRLVAAHGGYQASMIASTAQQHFSTILKDRDQPHSFNMHITFLRPMTAGKTELKVKDSRLGSGVSIIQVTLSQRGKERVAAFVLWVPLPRKSQIEKCS